MLVMAQARKRWFSPIFSPRNHLLFPRFFSSCTPQNPDPKPPQHFVVKDYLVSSFGFSAAKAATISKSIDDLKSPKNPEAVRHFLHHLGFAEADIKYLVTRWPDILCYSPKNVLDPRLRPLHKMGLSSSAITEVILSYPHAYQLSMNVPRVKFWMDFLGGQDEDLVKLLKLNKCLVCHDITGYIPTKLSHLESLGICTYDIRRILCAVKGFLTFSISKIEDMLKRAVELGFQPGSGMFVQGLVAMACLNREAFQKRIDLFKSIGWSDDEFLSAVQKAPTMVCQSEENLRAKLDFLLGEARCQISYIAFHPVLLVYSLEKRLRPRNHVLRLLESKEDFYNVINLSSSNFAAKFILPNIEEIPELREAYDSVRALGSGKTTLDTMVLS